jgi:hypothetical protein
MNFNDVFMPAVILAVGAFIVWLSVRRMLSLSAQTLPTWRRIAGRIVLSIVVLGYSPTVESPVTGHDF